MIELKDYEWRALVELKDKNIDDLRKSLAEAEQEIVDLNEQVKNEREKALKLELLLKDKNA